MDAQMIEVVQNLPSPISLADIMCFLGLDNHYRRFPVEFLSISYLLTMLT